MRHAREGQPSHGVSDVTGIAWATRAISPRRPTRGAGSGASRAWGDVAGKPVQPFGIAYSSSKARNAAPSGIVGNKGPAAGRVGRRVPQGFRASARGWPGTGGT